MAKHRHEYSIEEMATVLGVSRQGFYQTKRRGLSRRRVRWESFALLIRFLFEASGQTAGIRKIRRLMLRKYNIRMGHNQVWRLMKWQNLRSKRRKKFRIVTTDSRHRLPVAPNLVGYIGLPTEPNRIWVSDITYLRIPNGWIYLCVIMDLFSRKVVGWALRPHMQASLVTAALNMALRRRRPPGGLIFHSDRGSQYASQAVRSILSRCNCLQSMSGKGACWDNAWAESLFATIKLELGASFESFKSATMKLFQYLEAFYNRQRLHGSLDYQSPEDYEGNVA